MEIVSTQARFFTPELRSKEVAQSPKTRTLVDLGGQGDCGFRAIAAGIIDNASTHPRMHSELLSKLVSTYAIIIFPNDRMEDEKLATPNDIMKGLIKKSNTSQLVVKLALVLRQIAVDELVAHPVKYRGAFVANHEDTSPEVMRKADTWIDESSIAALAEALTMPIEVQMVEKRKELPMTLYYQAESEQVVKCPRVVVQNCGNHYMAKVMNPALFQSTVHVSPNIDALQLSDSVDNDPKLADIMQAIAEDDKKISEQFTNVGQRLYAMLEADEITTGSLLDLYITGMPTSDYLKGPVHHVGLEYGNTAFFDALDGAIDNHNEHESQITTELVHAIARAISIGHMNEETVFEQLNTSQGTKSSMQAVS